MRSEDYDKSLAVAYITDDSNGKPVLLEWQNNTTEPLLREPGPLAELGVLADAIDKHTPEDALLIAWWDISRRLKLLSKREMLFTLNLIEPVLLPKAWQQQHHVIKETERSLLQPLYRGCDTWGRSSHLPD